MQRIVIGLVGIKIREDREILKALIDGRYTVFSIPEDILMREKERREFLGHEVPEDLADSLRLGLGESVLAQMVGELIERSSARRAVIEGLTHPAEIDYLKERFGAFIIGRWRDGQERAIRDCLGISDSVIGKRSFVRLESEFRSVLAILTGRARGITLEGARVKHQRSKRTKESD